MSQFSSADLSQELAVMSDVFSDLGERLLGAARQLHSPGAPPPDTIAEELASTRRGFEALRDKVLNVAQSLEVACPPSEALDSLQSLTTLLDEVAAAETRRDKEENLRQLSLSVLGRALRLSHASAPDFGPLREIQDRARSLHETISQASWLNLPPEAQRLSEGDHPFAHLVTLVELRDDLEDDHWGFLHDSVGEAFGKSLAAAAARSKLLLPADEEETPESSMADPDAESRPAASGDRPPGGRRNLGRATPSSR